MNTSWTNEETELLCLLYTSCGSDIPALLKKYTPSAIVHKANKLGLSADVRSNKWTPAEDKLLMDKYLVEGDNIQSYLPGRSMGAITQRAYKLGLCDKLRRWTKEELDLLRAYYPTQGPDIPELLVTRTEDAIMTKARVLGLKSTKWPTNGSSSIPVTINGTRYPSTTACSKAEGISEEWIRGNRDPKTGIITASKPVPVRVIVGIYHGEEFTLQEACAKFDWPYNEKTRAALKYTNIVFEDLVDACLELDILPSSLVKLHTEFGNMQAVKEWVSTHRRAFRDRALLSSWRKSPVGGKPAIVFVNGVKCSSAHKLCEELGVKQDGRYVDFLCDASLDHQSIIDDFLRGGPSPIKVMNRASVCNQKGWGAWPEEELTLLLSSYEAGGLERCLEMFPKYTSSQIRRQLVRSGQTDITVMAPRGRSLRSPDVKSLTAATADYYYCTCKVCGRVFLIHAGDEVKFSHTTHANPAPAGWYVSPTKKVDK